MKHTPISNRDFYSAVSFGLLSALMVSLASGLGKYLVGVMNLSLLVFIRFLVPWLLLLPVYLARRKPLLGEVSRSIYIVRAISVVVSQYCFFYLLMKGNLLLAILLFSTNGMFLPFLARVFVKHEISSKNLIAVFLGFMGVGVALGPVHYYGTLNIVVGLFCGFSNAVSQVTLHQVSKKQDPLTTHFFDYASSGLMAFVLLLVLPAIHLDHFKWAFNAPVVWALILFSLFSIGNRLFRSMAYQRMNKAASLAPYLYTALIFAAFIDWVWLDIVPTWHTYMGISIILLSGVVMSVRLQDKQNT